MKNRIITIGLVGAIGSQVFLGNLYSGQNGDENINDDTIAQINMDQNIEPNINQDGQQEHDIQNVDDVLNFIENNKHNFDAIVNLFNSVSDCYARGVSQGNTDDTNLLHAWIIYKQGSTNEPERSILDELWENFKRNLGGKAIEIPMRIVDLQLAKQIDEKDPIFLLSLAWAIDDILRNLIEFTEEETIPYETKQRIISDIISILALLADNGYPIYRVINSIGDPELSAMIIERLKDSYIGDTAATEESEVKEATEESKSQENTAATEEPEVKEATEEPESQENTAATEESEVKEATEESESQENTEATDNSDESYIAHTSDTANDD
ncbi:MAG: hypothetical protein LBB20_02070 [Puniceicoccales bacterium]|nr:hypothetical protein [Puniceicoccales bacterium]